MVEGFQGEILRKLLKYFYVDKTGGFMSRCGILKPVRVRGEI